MKRLGKFLFRLFVIVFLTGMLLTGIEQLVQAPAFDGALLATTLTVAAALVWLVVKWRPKKKAAKKRKAAPASAKVTQATPTSKKVKTAVQAERDYNAELAAAKRRAEQAEQMVRDAQAELTARAARIAQEQTAPKAQAAQPEAKPYRWESIKFTVKGVTFEGRQRYLKKIAEYDEAYDSCYYEIQESDFQGEPAADIVVCLTNGDQKVIGKAPRELVQRVLALNELDPLVEVNVYGGDDGKNYGASCEISWRVYAD